MAYARPFRDTAERISLLPVFLDFYNRAPPHVSPMRGVTAIAADPIVGARPSLRGSAQPVCTLDAHSDAPASGGGLV